MDEPGFYAGVRIGGDMPPGIVRDREVVEERWLEHVMKYRDQDGPVRQAWVWALTGQGTSPVTLSPPSKQSPTRAELVEESRADNPDVVSEPMAEQIEVARRVLSWLSGESDELSA